MNELIMLCNYMGFHAGLHGDPLSTFIELIVAIDANLEELVSQSK